MKNRKKIWVVMITIKFFASLREEIGKTEVQMEISEPLTITKIWNQVCNGVPLPNHVLMAINMEYTNSIAVVKDGDEVAFFPPVTGG
ncbi:MAG: MoaD/ThiS family protein [Candidatus Marithrix sp.]|nr:MoaD/ThiS family protein [Candidatus Marithrix sp.]